MMQLGTQTVPPQSLPCIAGLSTCRSQSASDVHTNHESSVRSDWVATAALPTVMVCFGRGYRHRQTCGATAHRHCLPRQWRRRQPGLRRRNHSAVTVASSCYEVVALEGRGLGVVAKKDLVAGELVLAEGPMICFDTELGDWTEQVHRQFDDLPELFQNELMSLSDSEAAATGQPKTLEGVVRTNCIVREEGSRGGIVCCALSRFNHSCLPNCEATWSEECNEKRVYASTQIRAGDELCIFYTDVRAPRAERRHELRSRYGFLCNCAACAATAGVPLSDSRRTRMQELDTEIARIGARAPELALSMAQELLQLYDAEGLSIQSFRKRACYFMFQLKLRDDPCEAARWAGQAGTHAELCHGVDHPDTQALRSYAQDPFAVVG